MLRSQTALAVALVVGIASVGFGQTKYRLPPKEIVDIIGAKPAPRVNFSPDRKWMLHLDTDAMPSIKDVSKKMLRLGGLRIDPATDSRFTTSYVRGIKFIDSETLETLTDTSDGDEAGPRFSNISWSHRSNALAVVWSLEDDRRKGSYLSVAECEAGKRLCFVRYPFGSIRCSTVCNGCPTERRFCARWWLERLSHPNRRM